MMNWSKTNRWSWVRLLAIYLPALASLHAAEIQVDADFPGGNIVVKEIKGNQVWLAPDQRDIVPNQWWFYFNFRLRAPAGQPVTILFREKNPLGVRGPAVSEDGGKTWRWLGAAAVKPTTHTGKRAWSFEARVPAGAAEVRYAFCPPYLEADLAGWLEQHRNQPALQIGELTRSRQGRRVEQLRAGCLDARQAKGVVLVTSRHHACEAIATYTLEGLLEGVLAEDAIGRAWRERWELVVVPFMDKDGVELGDQGKYRAPHDHNRDYNAKPIYPEVSALMKLGAVLQGRVVAALDLHCPYISGEWNDRVYFVGAPEAGFFQREQAFAAVLERVQQGTIRFRAQDCLAFGVAWNQNNSFRQGKSFGQWARATFPQALVSSMEIAYADAHGDEVNAASARALGRDLARALIAYLPNK